MRAGTTCARKRSRSRGGTSPRAPWPWTAARRRGRRAALAAAGRRWPPCPAGLGAGRLGGAPVGLRLPSPWLSNPCRSTRRSAWHTRALRPSASTWTPVRVGLSHLPQIAASRSRQWQRRLALDDPALAELLRRALVLLHHVDVLDDHPPLGRQHAQDLAALALLPARDDQRPVSSFRIVTLAMQPLIQSSSDDLGGQRDDLGELPLPQLARHRPEDAGARPGCSSG